MTVWKMNIDIKILMNDKTNVANSLILLLPVNYIQGDHLEKK